MKKFRVVYKSRYYPLEGERFKIVRAESKKDVRNNWHSIMETDEYKIVRIEEVPA